MAFEFIRINDLRNLGSCEITPHKKINLIHGSNGSGKTSILEAIYILGRGRSFRDRQLIYLIKKGKDSFTIFGRKSPEYNRTEIGVSYSKKGANVKIDGVNVNKISTLAIETPVHIITPKSQEIVEKGSGIRRRFVDWGVFHVEPSYQLFSSRYQRALIQRNSALRETPKTAVFWDKELIESGTKIQEYREKYFELLKSNFLKQLIYLGVDSEVEMILNRGWNNEKTLEEVLVESLNGDIRRKHTRFGPHRADIQFRIENMDIDKWGSRGQLKIVTYCLFFAQTTVIEQLSKKQSILLIDDFTTELDKENIQKINNHLIRQASQIFITTTDEGQNITDTIGKMFHVEHGALFEEGV